ATFALASYFTADLVAAEFDGTGATTSKLKLMKDLLPLLRQHPWIGVGRGALGDASPSVVSGSVRALFAENLPLHWALEWGVPAALLVLALVAGSLVQVRPRRGEDWALALGFLALCAQNLVDFSLELAGVSCVAAVALGTMVAREGARERPSRFSMPTLRSLAPASCIAAMVAVSAAAPLLVSGGRVGLRDQLLTKLDDAGRVFSPLLGGALDYYPLDPNFIVLGAAHAVRHDDRAAARWLNLAMTVAPGWSAPHVQAAYFLERQGATSQAALELRLAFEADAEQTAEHARQFLQRHPSVRYAFEMLPDVSELRQLIAEALAGDLLSAPVSRSDFESFLRYMLEQFPSSTYAHARYVGLALEDRDLDLALQRALTMLERCPADPLSTATVMTVLVRAGRGKEALERFERAPDEAQTDRNLLFVALEAAGAARDRAALDRLVEDTFARYGTTAQARADIHRYVSTQYEAAGVPGLALSHAQQSYDLTGDLGMLERVHELAKQAGMTQVALRAATELCHVGRHREAYCQWGPHP
ncbi:MAG: hypothetical protein JWN04_5362, partial [Myxococcaceae bacterium]|nr:hypothetical protein [Myxococcaceae bacterium]